MSREAYLAKRVTTQDATMRFTPTAAVTAGEVVKVDISATRSIAGVALEAIAANATGTLDIKNIYDFPTASGQTWASGTAVYWDSEGSKAVPVASANGTDDFCLGVCQQARATTDKAFVRVRLNFGPSEFTRISSSSSSSSN
jgi:predicted RecA/RadA family phage recombinase